MFNARVPSGSLSHLSGKRFAAPISNISKSLAFADGEHVQWTMTWGLVSSMAADTASWEFRSSLMIEGGLARVNPVPTTVQPAREKAFTTCRPRRPVAPVMRTVLGIVVVFCGVG